MSAQVSIPTAEQVLTLPPSVVMVAPPEWEDGNGHVNVRHFYDLHLRGAAVDMMAMGLGDDYRERTGQSVFSVEQHIRYLGEVHVGDEVSVHLRWVARGDKVVHVLSLIVNRTAGTVVNLLEFLEAHVDLDSRRACSWSPAVADVIDGAVEAHEGLPWSSPLSGTLGVRR